MKKHSHKMVPARSSNVEYLKFAGVLTGILLISLIALGYTSEGGAMEWMRLFMGVFFLVFAGFKFAGYRMFSEMFAGYDLIAKRSKAYARAYPFIEAALGILYLADILPGYRDLAVLLIMSVGVVGVAGEIRRRSGVHCACLGNIIRLPLSTVSLVEDVAMGLMALAMIVQRWLM